MKNKFVTIGIIIATVILAGVAIFTAVRLYQLRQVSVAPNVPSSKPIAQEAPVACTALAFNLGSTPSPTPTPTSSPTPTPTTTPTGSPTPTGTPNLCGGTCGSNTNCGSGLYCYTTLGLCRNASCPTQSDCNCPSSPSPTPTPGRAGTPAPTPTPTAPTLPVSGTDWPTILGAGIGLFVIIGSLLLAL